MQLDLFMNREEPRPAATLFRFPLCRRAALIRDTAEQLRSRNERAGQRYWTGHIAKLRHELRRAGLARPDIDSEIRDYARAVRIECLSSRPLREVSR